MRSDITLVDNLVADFVKHVEVTIVIGKEKVVICHTGSCDPLVIDFGQMNDFFPTFFAERHSIIRLMAINASLEAIVADQNPIII